jgi:putative nucleic acid modification protein with dual OB domain
MRIVINHLTRMKAGFICVAGVELDTRRHVRPVLSGRLSRRLLTQEGGVFEIGGVVDLGAVKYVGRAPEIEDYLFDPANARSTEKLTDEQFWKLLDGLATSSFTDIFGPDLQPQGKGLALSQNKGIASLGCLRTEQPPLLTITEFFGKEQLRIGVSDAQTDCWLSVTDIRLYETDQVTPKYDAIRQVAQFLQEGEEAIMCVGLSRAWQKPGDSEPRHWLQLNNIHLKNHPL